MPRSGRQAIARDIQQLQAREGGTWMEMLPPRAARIGEWIERNRHDSDLSYRDIAQLAQLDGLKMDDSASRVTRLVKAFRTWRPGKPLPRTEVDRFLLTWLNERVFGRSEAEMDSFIETGEYFASGAQPADAAADSFRRLFLSIHSQPRRTELLNTAQIAAMLDRQERLTLSRLNNGQNHDAAAATGPASSGIQPQPGALEDADLSLGRNRIRDRHQQPNDGEQDQQQDRDRKAQ